VAGAVGDAGDVSEEGACVVGAGGVVGGDTGAGLADGDDAGAVAAGCARTERTAPRLAQKARVETADRMANRLVDMARFLALTGGATLAPAGRPVKATLAPLRAIRALVVDAALRFSYIHRSPRASGRRRHA
jgi:hypothetical protein